MEDQGGLRVVRAAATASRGERLVRRMRGRAARAMSTDRVLGLLRAD